MRRSTKGIPIKWKREVIESVGRLKSEGLSNKEIADRHGIKDHNVDFIARTYGFYFEPQRRIEVRAKNIHTTCQKRTARVIAGLTHKYESDKLMDYIIGLVGLSGLWSRGRFVNLVTKDRKMADFFAKVVGRFTKYMIKEYRVSRQLLDDQPGDYYVIRVYDRNLARFISERTKNIVGGQKFKRVGKGAIERW